MNELVQVLCEDNWNRLLAENEPLFGRIYVDDTGKKFRFFGLVCGEDDYYFGMYELESKKVRLVSCVGSLEIAGLRLSDKA